MFSLKYCAALAVAHYITKSILYILFDLIPGGILPIGNRNLPYIR
jgi:hypothetical protein